MTGGYRQEGWEPWGDLKSLWIFSVKSLHNLLSAFLQEERKASRDILDEQDWNVIMQIQTIKGNISHFELLYLITQKSVSRERAKSYHLVK
jgi:hypothetical protein